MAHAPLLRMNTGPAAPLDVVDRLNNMSAPRASQLSGSATFPTANSTTSLSSLTTATTFGTSSNGVVATSNIINQRADASRSLYQICVALKQRLAKVPGFELYLEQLEQMAADPDEGGPVESVWKLLRTGYPLLAIYNVLQPDTPLQVLDPPGASEAKRSKIAILRFVEACKSKLMLPPTDVFIITDLAGNDTTGFVKVGCLPSLKQSFACRPLSDMGIRSPQSLTMCSISPNNGGSSSRSNHTPKTTTPSNPAPR